MEMKRKQRPTAPDCLWKQAGVVARKKCLQDFSCPACRYEKAMRKACRENRELLSRGLAPAGKKGRLEEWEEHLNRWPVSGRPCIHHMKGEIEFKSCPFRYNCIDCEFDQYFYDRFKVHTVVKPVEFDEISGIRLPSGYYLDTTHTWVKVEGANSVRIGIDDFAAKIIGKPDFVVTPLMGKPLTRETPAVVFTRNGADVWFNSPVNGVITEVNPELKQTPDLVNQAPYSQGWVLTVHCPDLKQDLKHLMFMDDTKVFMEKEVDRLHTFLEKESGLKAADGGNLVSDIYGSLPLEVRTGVLHLL